MIRLSPLKEAATEVCQRPMDATPYWLCEYQLVEAPGTHGRNK